MCLLIKVAIHKGALLLFINADKHDKQSFVLFPKTQERQLPQKGKWRKIYNLSMSRLRAAT